MIYTVSNMWPTANKPNFGIFVKRIHENINYDKNIITLKYSENKILKIFLYIAFYLRQAYFYYRSNPKDVFIVHYISMSGLGILLIRIILGKRGKIIGFCHGSDVLIVNKGFKQTLLMKWSKLLQQP